MEKKVLALSFLVVLFYLVANLYDHKKYKKKFFNNEIKLEEEIRSVIQTFESSCECRKNFKILISKSTIYKTVYFVSEIDQNSNKTQDLYQLTQNEYEDLNFTCNLFNSLRRGKNQKVLSYSLFGTNDFFYLKLKKIVSTISQLYPGWLMRVYYDNSINKSIICELECLKDRNSNLYDIVDFCNINRLELKLNDQNLFLNASYVLPRMWRFLAIGDSFVNFFSSRDSDSFIFQREIDSVNVWLNSSMYGHIMRDHPAHVEPILAGMWGTHNSRNRLLSNHIFNLITNLSISAKYNPYRPKPKYGDQVFLGDYIYPLIKNISLNHDSYHCLNYSSSKWPTKRVGNCFVGSKWHCYKNSKYYTCPIECRQESNWESC